MPFSPANFLQTLQLLCGKTFDPVLKDAAVMKLTPVFDRIRGSDEFGHRQLNEVLLLLNERIVSNAFFEFLASEKRANGTKRCTIMFSEFGKRVDEFRKLAMLQYGSFRFAFNFLCHKQNVAESFLPWLRDSGKLEADYKNRAPRLFRIYDMPPDKLWRLGYVSGRDARDSETIDLRKKGRENFDTYLTWDYLDVYVATSMREPWDYITVHNTCKSVFKDSRLGKKKMKVRYFDPTLSFHHNPVAKGLIEGLMLKRAKCTLYMVQERDTMGKDSEMAATLAQGKPVIAYIPEIDIRKRIRELEVVRLPEILGRAENLRQRIDANEVSEFDRCYGRLRDIWDGSSSPDDLAEKVSLESTTYRYLVRAVAKAEKKHYDSRYQTIQNDHPLHFQINLTTGVANGLLVVRTEKECADLIYMILTNRLEFTIKEEKSSARYPRGETGLDNYLLKEAVSKSSFRVVTGDERLTNSFWNLYRLSEESSGQGTRT